MPATLCDDGRWLECRAALTKAIFNATLPPERAPDLILPGSDIGPAGNLSADVERRTQLQALLWTIRSQSVRTNSVVFWSLNSSFAPGTRIRRSGCKSNFTMRGAAAQQHAKRCERGSNTLVLYHHGHEENRCVANSDGVTGELNALGFDTMEMYMPSSIGP